MMKKTLFFVMAMLLLPWSSVTMRADYEEIPLSMEIIDPTDETQNPHRGPVLIPGVSIDGYTLLFGTPCDGSVLRLLDEDGYVVYSTVIPTGTTTLPLPTTLSGEYELQIIQGGWCFYGWIEL